MTYMMHHLWDTTHWKVCDLDLTFKGIPRSRSQGQLKIIYDYIYVLQTNIGHMMQYICAALKYYWLI